MRWAKIGLDYITLQSVLNLKSFHDISTRNYFLIMKILDQDMYTYWHGCMLSIYTLTVINTGSIKHPDFLFSLNLGWIVCTQNLWKQAKRYPTTVYNLLESWRENILHRQSDLWWQVIIYLKAPLAQSPVSRWWWRLYSRKRPRRHQSPVPWWWWRSSHRRNHNFNRQYRCVL